MDLLAPKHLILILLIVLLVFGGKKLKTLGSDLGGAFRGFKKAMSDGENEEQAKQMPGQIPGPTAAKDAEFPEVAASKPHPQPVNEQKATPHA
ncbi:MAG TPA: twin-arginine translocase TatA/TatE family subunit [Steroidobacteraceae bacterium]|jgi:sec-independent protein translocase protein TatA|nr:twin-arginine translocase TatA/TatE family subunit [Steroidobacteraceae bacterium]